MFTVEIICALIWRIEAIQEDSDYERCYHTVARLRLDREMRQPEPIAVNRETMGHELKNARLVILKS